MGAIKRTPADIAFSKCVRARAGWKCERCGSQHDASSIGLDCSHHHSRANWSIRFEPMGAEALCYGCHSRVGGTQDRRDEVLTRDQQDILNEKKNNLSLGREARKTKGVGAIAKHYRMEYKRMLETGSREFVGYF